MNPLPLKNGVFFIDASTLEHYTTCRRSFEYFSVEGRVAPDERGALNFGSAVHEALGLRYNNEDQKTLATIETEQLQHLEKFFAKSPQPLNEWRSPALADDLIRRYNAEYGVEPFRVRGVEQSFAIPLTRVNNTPVFWTGKIDLITKWSTNDHWVVDHKTTSQLGATFFDQFKNDQAQLGYVWAANHVCPDVQGFMINALYTCRSDPARSSKRSGEFFSRQKFFVDRDRLEEWEENTIQIVVDIFRDAARGFFPMESKWCVGKYGRCQYLPVCELPKASKKLVLHSSAYTKNEWSPLNQPHSTTLMPVVETT